MRIFKKFLIPILSLSLFVVSCSSNEEPTTQPVDNTGFAPPIGEYTVTNTFYKDSQFFTNISTVTVAVTGDICKITAKEVIVKTYDVSNSSPIETLETNSNGLELTINEWRNFNKSADNGGTNSSFGIVNITKPSGFAQSELSTIKWNYISADKTSARLYINISKRGTGTGLLHNGTKEISFTGYKSL